MLMPKRVKYRKHQRGRMKGKAIRGGTLSFGDWGIQSLSPGWITSRQIEASRVTLVRALRKGGKMWIRIFPDKPYTKKPADTRMGKGKGEVEGWVAPIKSGRVLFEIAGLPEGKALDVLRVVTNKLPVRTRILSRESIGTVL